MCYLFLISSFTSQFLKIGKEDSKSLSIKFDIMYYNLLTGLETAKPGILNWVLVLHTTSYPSYS